MGRGRKGGMQVRCDWGVSNGRKTIERSGDVRGRGGGRGGVGNQVGA